MIKQYIESMGDRFAPMPRCIRTCKGLTNNAKLVYLAILDRAYDKPYSYPSEATLADEVKLSIRQTIRYIEELRNFGLIKVYRPAVKEKNNYVIMPLEWVNNLKSESDSVRLERALRRVEGENTERKFIPVSKDKQFIDSEEEFNELVQRISKHYERTKKV